MRFRSLKYLFVYLTPLVVWFSLAADDHWSFFAVLFVFVVLPILELFTKGSTENLTPEEEEMAKNDPFYDYLLYSLVPIQYVLLLYYLVRISNPELNELTRVGMMFAFGMACGILGINAAHELGHRSTKHEQAMSKLLLLTTLYQHFFIEHNRGHHKNVSTDEDPASSRRGENLYSFWVRSIRDSWLSAWKLEVQRLQKAKLPFWSWENEMIRFSVYQTAFISLIFGFFGWKVGWYYLGSALVGILLLETVNYIEHYGLRRNKTEKGYERTQPIHSWNSNHPIGRLVLL
ncbi:MAG: alkane 1-monooxygenase, partial [Bacteroidia bacterium]|nr:alkane 1-monooxygenase [Bacteroidia bacterium]